MSRLKYLLFVQRKLAPFTLAMGMVVPAAAREPVVEPTVRTPPAMSSRLPGDESLLSAVHRFPSSKFGSAGRPVVGIRVPSRISAQRPRVAFGKQGFQRNETAAEEAQAAAPAPVSDPEPAPTSSPAPAPAPEPAAQPENENPQTAAAPVPSLEVAPAPAAQPQIPEVQPVAPGSEAPAAGVELPW
jgi:hypothetical protein